MNACPICELDMGDDQHWHSELEVDVCDTCCPECLLPPVAASVPDDTGRVSSVPGERRTATHGAPLRRRWRPSGGAA